MTLKEYGDKETVNFEFAVVVNQDSSVATIIIQGNSEKTKYIFTLLTESKKEKEALSKGFSFLADLLKE